MEIWQTDNINNNEKESWKSLKPSVPKIQERVKKENVCTKFTKKKIKHY